MVAIGNFDGVHEGHQAILQAARTAAGDGTVVALTFWPHPLSILRPEKAPALLCGIEDRVELLKAAGADEVSIVTFTPELGAWSPERFVEAVLVPLRPTAVVVGQNFRFGAGAEADGHQMRTLAGGRFDVTVLPMLCDDGPVSSSRVRKAVAAGDVARAAQMLGRWFRYSGLVVHGNRRGHTLGFPTANITVAPGAACLPDAVYAGYLVHGADRWPAAISVGSNPTFDGIERRVEAHAIGRTDLELYGERVGVDFVAHLRPQSRFASPEELIAQLTRDVAATRRIIGGR
ncbi:MAG: riboflavin biosynthesis protein RibF [Propionibacteriaceae bacterium]|nr:riboflavin biosynthesis protein RibF [Propionibacteriaceae bacterium]